jgi:predicted lipoprotein with Yx(FWY)xxD motif
MVKKTLMLVAPLAALVVLAGCGSSKSSSATTSAAAASSSSQATTSSTASTPTEGAAPAAASAALTITTKPSKLGTILAAGQKKMTVYLFEADSTGRSTCSGACEGVWPPVTTSSSPQVGGAAMAADLATISRPNGTKQITYKGHPLYFFAKDKDNGDAYGQDIKSFGAGWYALAPSGTKVEQHKGGKGGS